MAMQQSAVEWGTAHKKEFLRTAEKLGFIGEDGQTLIFGDDSELSILMDCLLYEQKIDQRRVITAFLAQYSCTDQTQRLLSHVMQKVHFGLYSIQETDPAMGEIKLKALVAPESVDTTLVNVFMAETATPGLIIAAHILTLPEFSIYTGICFVFVAEHEKRVVREWWKKSGLDRFANMYRLSKKEAIKTEFL